MPRIPELLEKLLATRGPSGYEEHAAAVWREEAPLANLSTDGLGSSIATIGDAGPLLAVVGHIDEIGLVVTHIDGEGFLFFAPIGLWDPHVLVGQRVRITGRNGDVPGVIGRNPIHLFKDRRAEAPVELDSLYIDLGVRDRVQVDQLVRVGDPAVIAIEPIAVGDRLVARALDDRLGAYVALEAVRRCAKRGSLACRLAAVATVQEESGYGGAIASAFSLAPDVALAIDVTFASDTPGMDPRLYGAHPLGSGPVICRGVTLSPIVSELLCDVAERLGIAYTLEASGRGGTATDADAIQAVRGGIATGLINIPVRYMHSPVEMVDLDDVEATVELVVGFAESLNTDTKLAR